MSKSLGRGFSRQPKHDPTRMGLGSSRLGQMGQGTSRVLDSSSKIGQQGSRNMMSSGNRGPASSQPARGSDQTSSLLASFGLSSSDLDELSRLPEDKITAENLPTIIQHLKRKRSEHVDLLSNRERLSHDKWDNRPVRRASFDDRPLGDYSHDGSSREQAYRERHIDEPSQRRSESDYDRSGFSPLQRPVSRGMPSGRNIDDFHGVAPKVYPHFCSLCDLPLNSFQSWKEHTSGRLHKKQCLVLLDLYPKWKAQGTPTGIVGQSKGPVSVDGPNARQGNLKGSPGIKGGQGPKPIPKIEDAGRVIHVVDFIRTKNLKPQLMKLVGPFGTVTKILILNARKEAFIEMSTPEQANAIIKNYEKNPAFFFGKPVRFLLSQKYKQIKTFIETSTPAQANAKVKNYEKNAAQLHGKPVGFSLSQKYKQIKKKDVKAPQKEPHRAQSPKQQSYEGPGCVVRLCNLPLTGYYDYSVIKLAKAFGKVKTYIIMRMKHQAFVEMGSAEEAQNMVDRCAQTPLMFKGRELKVLLSRRYKTLVLRIPNNSQMKRNRKRVRALENKAGNKKKKPKVSAADQADMVTAEDDDVGGGDDDGEMALVPCASDPEEEEEATTVVETSVLEDEEEPNVSVLDQNGSSKGNGEGEHLSSTPALDGDQTTPAFNGNMEGFVTLDEIGTDDVESLKPEEKMEMDQPDSKGTTETTNKAALASDKELGPYQPTVPIGVEYVIPKTGYYCRLCSLFYTNEDMAKVTHCSSLAHYQKIKSIWGKPGKSPEKKN